MTDSAITEKTITVRTLSAGYVGRFNIKDVDTYKGLPPDTSVIADWDDEAFEPHELVTMARSLIKTTQALISTHVAEEQNGQVSGAQSKVLNELGVVSETLSALSLNCAGLAWK